MWTNAVLKFRRTYTFYWFCLVVLTVAITCCESTFEWSCSTPVNNVTFFPDIPTNVSDPLISNERTIPTPVGQLFIYPVPQEVQRCSGTVTGVQYCYKGQSVSFTLLIFVEPVDSTGSIQYNVSQVIPIINNGSMCSGSVCCASSTFNADTQFQLLETGVFTYGIRAVESSILGFHSSADYNVSSYLRSAAELMDSMITISPPTISSNTLRIVQFIVETSTTTALSDSEITTDPSTARTPQTTTSPDNDVTTADPSTAEATLSNTAMTSSPQVGDGDDSSPSGAVGTVVGVLVSAVLLMVGVFVLVICIRTRRRSTDKWNPEVVSERQPVDSNKIEGISNAIYGAGAGDLEVGMELDSLRQPRKSISNSNYDYARVDTPPNETKGHEYATADELSELRKAEVKYSYATTGPAVPPARDSRRTVPGSSHKSRGSITDAIYMVPACDENSLYAQFTVIKIKALSHSAIKLKEKLGAGQFGTVHKAEMLTGDKTSQLVAVKTLNKGVDEADKVKFLQEAAIMGQFRHPNVVKLYGVVTEEEPVMIVLELLLTGDLRNQLIKSKEGKCGIDVHTLLSYCRQIASGMAYLSSKAFVHRDLAARNILVSEEGVCKVADFGMSRDLMDETYYISHGGKIPVRWTAPEALHYKKYSTASDVWSFGCVMYEIWSLGHKPFEAFSNNQTIKEVDEGYRLAPPPGTPRTVYKLMMECWHPVKGERPTFTELMQELSLPDTKLLHWRDEDRDTHPEASTLGAPLNFTEQLYMDLQESYVVSKNSVGTYETPVMSIIK
ncbi:hepatocyte growth factor receptor-like isoform X2 [Halichondria panicea]|uniref:hepatocyte growth factor receptor-like isoform X2 n=1 Tax=Halichondria panicea TaxID=6063 RepID=UPI00312B92C9